MLISPSAIERMDVEAQEIMVTLARAQIEESASLDTADIELIETLPQILII